MKLKRSITELPNCLSSEIDLAPPEGIVRILRQADAQIFSGFLDLPGMFDTPNLDTMTALAHRLAKTIRSPRGVVVMSGAGTSGRLAMFVARTFNAVFASTGRAPFRYLMAGGDAALVQAQEGAEDDSTLSVRDLRDATADADDVFFIGITCGMSAPYIAGQLEALVDRPDSHAVLLGFSPLELARDTVIEGYHATFRQIAAATAGSSNGTLLNPVVGPEPVTGSTRMKSGSATKILLEVLFHAARMILAGRDDVRARITAMMRDYEAAVRGTYLRIDDIAALVSAGGDALRAHGHIYYLGGAGEDPAGPFGLTADAGILGLVDASECPPTYGASFEDVRGFVGKGWLSLVGHTPDFVGRGTHYHFSFDDFRKQKMDTLTADDLVVFLGDFAGRDSLMRDVAAAGAKTAAVDWTPRTDTAAVPHIAVSLPIAFHEELGWGPLQLGVKLVINALTTAAHILAGKVYGNRMVDLRISNNKLFYRTVGIIADLIGVTTEEATEALLRSVFETDALTDAQRNAPVSECIERAKSVEKVVPKALLIATGRFGVEQAAATLSANPIVRAAIEQFVQAK